MASNGNTLLIGRGGDIAVATLWKVKTEESGRRVRDIRVVCFGYCKYIIRIIYIMEFNRYGEGGDE